MNTTKKVPQNAKPPATSGPYSPVLEVECAKLVVISGQVAVDPEGNIVGSDIKTQTRHTLLNCERQLALAGCSLSDVFKCNVFMADLAEWGDMNEVYKEMMPDPRPARTAVQAGLLTGYLVEIEMWAAKE